MFYDPLQTCFMMHRTCSTGDKTRFMVMSMFYTVHGTCSIYVGLSYVDWKRVLYSAEHVLVTKTMSNGVKSMFYKPCSIDQRRAKKNQALDAFGFYAAS